MQTFFRASVIALTICCVVVNALSFVPSVHGWTGEGDTAGSGATGNNGTVNNVTYNPDGSVDTMSVDINGVSGQNPAGSGQNPAGSGQNPSTGGSVKLLNPLAAKDISSFLLQIIDIILVFALPIIVLFIMYAGFTFVTAQGNSEQISKARTMLMWAIIGGVIVLGADIIVKVIQETVNSIKAP